MMQRLGDELGLDAEKKTYHTIADELQAHGEPSIGHDVEVPENFRFVTTSVISMSIFVLYQSPSSLDIRLVGHFFTPFETNRLTCTESACLLSPPSPGRIGQPGHNFLTESQISIRRSYLSIRTNNCNALDRLSKVGIYWGSVNGFETFKLPGGGHVESLRIARYSFTNDIFANSLNSTRGGMAINNSLIIAKHLASLADEKY